MIMDSDSNSTKVTFGVKEWVAIGTVVVAIISSQFDLRHRTRANEGNIERASKSIEHIVIRLDKIIRTEEQIKALNQRIQRMEDADVRSRGGIPFSPEK